jgi:hypothetical protein
MAVALKAKAPKKINYLNNKDILKEIHTSKNSYCSFVDPEYHRYDIIIDMPIIQTLPSCRDCNSGISNGYQRVLNLKTFVSSAVVNAGREAFERWFYEIQRLPLHEKIKLQKKAIMFVKELF